MATHSSHKQILSPGITSFYCVVEVCFVAPYVARHCVLKQLLTAHTNDFCRLTLFASKIELTPFDIHLAFLSAVASYVQHGR
jgi:hypothetical protein